MNNYRSVNPATGELLAEYPILPDEALAGLADRSQRAYSSWRWEAVEKRADLLVRTADLYAERADDLAKIATEEMGKPIAEARKEAQLAAAIFRYYGLKGPELLADEVLHPRSGDNAVVRSAPLGPLLGIMPWNYPYYQVARFAAPNLLLGNTIILKHARSVPGAALAIEALFHEAGLPAHTYQNAFVSTGQVADLIADPRICGVSLTGSEKAGTAVAEIAGRHLKKHVLELGGADPFIVLDDRNLDRTVRLAVLGRINNGGQACAASKRFIVLDEAYESFVTAFAAAMAGIKPGDPTDPDTLLGPLSSEAAVEELLDQIRDATDQGAVILAGGRRADRPGAFLEATVLTDVTPQMRAYHEELFGPVAVVHRAASVDEAVEIANDSPFGLGAAVFTADEALGHDVADRLEAGMVTVNGVTQTQPDLPFGGVKGSGIGRELGRYGLEEFVNKKLIRVPHMAGRQIGSAENNPKAPAAAPQS
ncbi:succinate-semialdehyde dehydrogenase [Sinomonas atrocyanea]|uniref:Succinate-semialdehyde dehydrogenase n=1 Tax=Sinomonas atrocyanea TaxID=37927 RepID=A0A127A1E7_9MICC|nr:NAD-dependent succinate-semialdehyde dehydrogenase [Sinomonas atrocyanea]AMM32926.1 succinate-semialdehyde dehydrogenase [Sinomonas atrocyanea]GEB66488.1 succinate-semialdehyde dehydrogenase [NADP(+)] [Sinomonas atrocyanea]GGG80674.1 succinate-semialdehyde dehydrogenase [NADP(+)] [Sinomonas atrocyanea]